VLPQAVLSSTPVSAPFLSPDDLDPGLLVDREYGGIAIRDPSQGLRVQIWTFGFDGTHVTATSPATGTINLFTDTGVTELSGAFDQNMNPVVAFITGGVPKLWWFDSVASAQVFTTYFGISSLKVALDDKRTLETRAGTNDVIFAYLKANQLCFRAQRDRYTIEYPLSTIDTSKFKFAQMGMNSVNRFQFKFEPLT
jgi:hypothetical protein